MSSDLSEGVRARSTADGTLVSTGFSRRTGRAWAGLEIVAFVVVPVLVLVAVATTTVLVTERTPWPTRSGAPPASPSCC